LLPAWVELQWKPAVTRTYETKKLSMDFAELSFFMAFPRAFEPLLLA